MATHAFTLRLPTQERQALENLSRIEGRPMNQILNDAIKAYLHRQSDHERKLEASLETLRAYRQRDPDYKEAIAAVAAGEASYPDPLEGTLVHNAPPDHASATSAKARRPEPRQPANSGQSRLRSILNA